MWVLLSMRYKHIEAVAYYNSYFGDHPLTYGAYFNCFGNESSLSNCQTSSTSCNFANTAGVFCRGDVITGTAINMNMIAAMFSWVHALNQILLL